MLFQNAAVLALLRCLDLLMYLAGTQPCGAAQGVITVTVMLRCKLIVYPPVLTFFFFGGCFGSVFCLFVCFILVCFPFPLLSLLYPHVFYLDSQSRVLNWHFMDQCRG